jgi:HAD superfamily hydrolase (TIGR01509 family)
MMGRPSDISLQLMIDYHSLTDSVEQLAAEGQTIFTALLDQHLAPMPGLLSLLESLQASGIPRAIATSSRPDFAYDVLQRFNLVPSFQFVLTAKDVVQGKPHPEIYLEAARRLSIPPAQVMVLEDSQNGCRAAVAAGAFAIAVPGEHSRGHDFSGAQFIADSLEDPRIDQCLGFTQPRAGRLRT